MTKAEIQKLANDCGFDAVYSGNENKFFFKKREGIHNLNVDREKLEKFLSITDLEIEVSEALEKSKK